MAAINLIPTMFGIIKLIVTESLTILALVLVAVLLFGLLIVVLWTLAWYSFLKPAVQEVPKRKLFQDSFIVALLQDWARWARPTRFTATSKAKA